jgi:hypothetical protein
MLTKNKRKVLKRVRKMIATGEQEFICHALSYVAHEDIRLEEACRKLRAYITEVLAGNYTLYCWQKANGIADSDDDRQLRKDRLAWIDWMLDEPKPLHDETYCLAA